MRVISDVNVVVQLNRVVAMLCSSLVNYLADAEPWSAQSNDVDVVTTLQQIAANQDAIVSELSDYIVELDGVVETGNYPTEYTGYHDLAFSYLAPMVVDQLERQANEMESISQSLASDARAQGLVDRAIGAAKAHADMLRERVSGQSV